jgi:hypothetical protein
VSFAVPLDSQSSLAWIQVLHARDQYVLLASQESGAPQPAAVQPLPIANSSQQNRMHGRVYAFHGETGKLQWQVPAFVAHHALPPDQPLESPLLFFAGTRQGNNNLATAVLVLDRRTGRSVYESDQKGAMAVTCDIVASLPDQTVTLSLIGQSNRAISFHLTDKPQPPQPPAQTGQMASSEAGQPPGTVDRTIEAAMGAINRGLNPGGIFGGAQIIGPPLPMNRP